MRSHPSIFVALLTVATGCNAQPSVSPKSLRYLGGYEIPFNKTFKGTTIGGLSGIDYDISSGTCYMICDDRSAINPARFYTAKIVLKGDGIDSVQFTETHPLLQPDDHPYPNAKQNPGQTPDPEAIRFNAVSKELIWSSEGERSIKGTGSILADPVVVSMGLDGKYINNFPLPSNLKMQATENGPRQNGTLEGLTFSDNYTTLYVSLEEPLYEDGPRSGLQENNAWIRIFKFDVASKKNIAQFAYRLEPVAYAPVPEKSFMVNGITDILSLGKNKLLVVERSFSTGRLPCTVKVFLADLAGAQDVLSVPSLLKASPSKPIAKTLLLNMDDLGIYIDNIEGVTFGPNLSNGHKTLIFIADNNFNFFEKSQLLLFEVIE